MYFRPVRWKTSFSRRFTVIWSPTQDLQSTWESFKHNLPRENPRENPNRDTYARAALNLGPLSVFGHFAILTQSKRRMNAGEHRGALATARRTLRQCTAEHHWTVRQIMRFADWSNWLLCNFADWSNLVLWLHNTQLLHSAKRIV